MNIMTQERVKDLFEYDNGRLLWRETRGPTAMKGKSAGSTRPTGHRLVVDGKEYLRARLIFLMFHGEIPQVVSRADGNRLNDRITNLIASTFGEVRIKDGIISSNKSGVRGISWDNTRKRWSINRCRGYKNKCIGTHKELSGAKEMLEAYNLSHQGTSE